MGYIKKAERLSSPAPKGSYAAGRRHRATAAVFRKPDSLRIEPEHSWDSCLFVVYQTDPEDIRSCLNLSFMKTVRFAKVVESCGKPDTHLLLTDPAEDKALQAAIKSNRVMTIYQLSGSTKTDYGTVGFEKGTSRQFFLFPKILEAFAGQRVIGIKYDLLESIPVSAHDQAPKPTGDRAPKAIAKSKAVKKKPSARVGKPRNEHPKNVPPDKLVEFPKARSNEAASAAGNEVEELKRRVREAMDILEQGKQVAAFNLLKRIVEGT
jgi:hypothetical protein